MSHEHHHHHHHGSDNLKTAFFLNIGFTIIEIIGGLWTNSVAILSDALHDLGDSIVIGLSWYFSKLSKRGRDKTFSYGYKRFNVLGAVISSLVLLTGSIFIISEAIPRLLDPVQPDTSGMIVLGIIGVVVNGVAALRVKTGHSLNEQAVYWHLLEDVLGWIVTLIGAVVMHFTDLPQIDAYLSIGIAAFILYGVSKNLFRGFKIILQATPTDVDLDKIHEVFRNIDGVIDFHDCHIWSMDGEYHVLSIHLIVPEQNLDSLQNIKREAKKKLSELGIDHSTIEFEMEGEECHHC